MIGIISDSHDNLPLIKRAVEMLKGCDKVVHCGDIVAPATVKCFQGLPIEFVKGNCDGDVPMLHDKASEIGSAFHERYLEFEHQGKKFLAIHGDDEELFGSLLESGRYDYILRGHTHTKGDYKVKETVIINPGSLYLGTPPNSIAKLECQSGRIEYIELR